jgi:Flp pilus assembly pilin Flp
MRHILRRFFRSESGATTVDWVVITALAMTLSLAAFGSVRTGTKTATDTVSTSVAARPTTINW